MLLAAAAHDLNPAFALCRDAVSKVIVCEPIQLRRLPVWRHFSEVLLVNYNGYPASIYISDIWEIIDAIIRASDSQTQACQLSPPSRRRLRTPSCPWDDWDVDQSRSRGSMNAFCSIQHDSECTLSAPAALKWINFRNEHGWVSGMILQLLMIGNDVNKRRSASETLLSRSAAAKIQ